MNILGMILAWITLATTGIYGTYDDGPGIDVTHPVYDSAFCVAVSLEVIPNSPNNC